MNPPVLSYAKTSPFTRGIKFFVQKILLHHIITSQGTHFSFQLAFPLMEIPLSGEMSEGQKGAVSGEEKGDRLRWMR